MQILFLIFRVGFPAKDKPTIVTFVEGGALQHILCLVVKPLTETSASRLANGVASWVINICICISVLKNLHLIVNATKQNE